MEVNIKLNRHLLSANIPKLPKYILNAFLYYSRILLSITFQFCIILKNR